LPSDVWNAPQAEVLKIYKQNYWDKMRCDELPSGVDYAVFDYGVNSGVSRAIKVLQKVTGADVDGEIGPDTIKHAVVLPPSETIHRISDERIAFLHGLNTWSRFGRGWTTRVNDVKALALKMVTTGATGETGKPAQSGWAALWAAFLAWWRGSPTTTAPPPTPPKPMPGALPWMAWATKEVGFHESGTNRNIQRYTGPAKCGSEGDPWCAIFVNAALETANIPGTRSAMARSFERHPNFVKLDGPAYGAITTMWRGSPGAGTGHVFFYLGHIDDSRVLALGGNQSDQVCRQAEPTNRIVGYYWPKSVPLPKTGRISVDEDAEEGSES
jgi:uncharacterized protein (TIGR02594 family)